MKAVTPLNPIEKVNFPTPVAEEMPTRLRERYRDYIKEELPLLAKIIDAHWTAQEANISGMTGEMGMPSGFGNYGAMSAMSSMSAAMPNSTMSVPGTMGTDPITGKPIVDTSKVLWQTQDQSSLMAQYDWRARNNDRLPTTLDVLYAGTTRSSRKSRTSALERAWVSVWA
jgi:hypothetical protein